MARFSSAFFDARNKEADRIDKKRKDNRESFLAYRKTKAELGEDVTAEELQLYRQSLAGSDAFFLRDLGPGEMLGDLAKRTNQRSLETRRAEDANEVERKSNEISMFDTWVGQNLNLDPTDTASAKESFMQNFVGQEDIGERLWTQNEGRLMESIDTSRADSAQTYVTNRLEGVNDTAQAERIMAADNLPQWKKASITNIIGNRQSVDLGNAKARAEELVNQVEGSVLIDADEAALQDRAGVIIRSAQVKLDPSSQEYIDLHAAIVATLENRQATAITTDTKIREEKFSNSILSKDSQFVITYDAKGYDDEAVFDAYNYERDIAGLPRAKDMNDTEFQQYVQAAANRESIQYEADYGKAVETAVTAAQAAVEAAQTEHESLSLNFDEGTVGYNVLASMSGKYVPTIPSTSIIARLEEAFPGKLDSTERDGNLSAQVFQFLVGSGIYASTSVTLQKEQEKRLSMKIKPGTDLNTFATTEADGYKEKRDTAIETMNARLDIGASPEELQKALDKIIALGKKQIELDAVVVKESRGAFAEGPSGEVDSYIETMKTEQLKELEKLSIDDLKPTGVPNNKFTNQNNNVYRAKPGSNDIIDTEGNPVVPGQMYVIENGDVRPMASAQTASQLTQLFPISVGRGRGNFNGTNLQALGNQIAQLNDPSQSVYGFKPIPYGTQGAFNTPSKYVISVVKQMAEAYRASDPSLSGMTDRQFFNLIGQPGKSNHGVTPFDF